MYELCLYNCKLKKFFVEIYDSPYLLRKRLCKLKYAKNIKCSSLNKKM